MMIVFGIAGYVEHDQHDGNPVHDTAWEIMITEGTRHLATTAAKSLDMFVSGSDNDMKIIEDIELPFIGSVEGMTARLLWVTWSAGECWYLLYPLPVAST